MEHVPDEPCESPRIPYNFHDNDRLSYRDNDLYLYILHETLKQTPPAVLILLLVGSLGNQLEGFEEEEWRYRISGKVNSIEKCFLRMV